MLYLVTGGSGSGKSEFAEKLAVSRHQSEHWKGKLCYIATMYPYDEECHARIRKHQCMRKDKGFTTVECYTQLEELRVGKEDVILLECMSNLLANEMYQENGRITLRGKDADLQLEQAILQPILQLERQAGCLIIVTNEVFSDGAAYEEETMEYLRLLGKINTFLARDADAVVEVVCSIPVYHRGEIK